MSSYKLKSSANVGLAEVAAKRAAAIAAGVQVISQPIGIPDELKALPMGARFACTFIPGSVKEIRLTKEDKELMFFSASYTTSVNGKSVIFSSILMQDVELAILSNSTQILTGTRGERGGNPDVTVSVGAPVVAGTEQMAPPAMAAAPVL